MLCAHCSFHCFSRSHTVHCLDPDMELLPAQIVKVIHRGLCVPSTSGQRFLGFQYTEMEALDNSSITCIIVQSPPWAHENWDIGCEMIKAWWRGHHENEYSRAFQKVKGSLWGEWSWGEKGGKLTTMKKQWLASSPKRGISWGGFRKVMVVKMCPVQGGLWYLKHKAEYSSTVEKLSSSLQKSSQKILLFYR